MTLTSCNTLRFPEEEPHEAADHPMDEDDVDDEDEDDVDDEDEDDVDDDDEGDMSC